MKTLKRILVQLTTGANVMAALLLWLCGMSANLSPAEFPRVAIFGLGFPLLLLLNLGFVMLWLIFYIRRVWVALVGICFSASYIYSYCPVNWPAKHPEGSLKVMTYNTEFIGRSEADEAGCYPVLEYLASCGADVICLQESTSQKNLSRDEMDRRLEQAGYRTLHLDDGHSEPQLVYSRLPLVSIHRICYETAENGSVAVKLLYEGDTVLVVNNHFESYKLTPEDKQHYKDMIKDPEHASVEENSRALVRKMAKANRLRGPQVDSVLNFIGQAGCRHVIVCGDFNDSPISYVCNRMGSKLKSAYRQSGNGLGFTYNQKGFFFRIDHIYISSGWRSYETHVDKSIDCSDHYPLVTYLKKVKK